MSDITEEVHVIIYVECTVVPRYNLRKSHCKQIMLSANTFNVRPDVFMAV
jgi:hypothetical protein